MKCPKQGLYAITQTANKTLPAIISEVTAALHGGAVMVQYRDKQPINAALLASELVTLCHHYHVPLIINDDVALALAVGADGVHLGQQDGSIAEAREQLGADAIIGVSCYNALTTALQAQANGADYVAFGRFFPSRSKPLAAPASLETLHQARQVLSLPIIAIGGILPENGAGLLAAGANILAVIDGLFGNEIAQAAKAYQILFDNSGLH